MLHSGVNAAARILAAFWIFRYARQSASAAGIYSGSKNKRAFRHWARMCCFYVVKTKGPLGTGHVCAQAVATNSGVVFALAAKTKGPLGWAKP